MEAVIAFAREGGPVLGICNGFQVLCEAGLLPGALLPNAALRFVCRQVHVSVERADTPWTAACEPGESSRSRSSTRGRYFAPPECWTARGQGPGRAALRAPAEPERLPARHRRRRQRAGERGRPDAAPRARGRPLKGSEDGAEALRLDRPAPGGGPGLSAPAAPARAAAPRRRAWPHRRRARADRELLGREPNGSSWRCSACCGPSTAPTSTRRSCCGKLPTEGTAVLMGPGENAGAVDAGDGLAVVFKVESHNHPSAVEPFQGAATGVGGILRDIFALGARPDRGARLAALRRPRHRRARATCSSASSPESALRELRRGARRSAERSTSSRPTSRTAS